MQKHQNLNHEITGRYHTDNAPLTFWEKALIAFVIITLVAVVADLTIGMERVTYLLAGLVS